MPDSYKYASFAIPKKSGGVRTIQAPCKRLKVIQWSLKEALDAVTGGWVGLDSLIGFLGDEPLVMLLSVPSVV
jgi:hypothetical protein